MTGRVCWGDVVTRGSAYRTASAPPGRRFELKGVSSRNVHVAVLSVALVFVGIMVGSMVLDVSPRYEGAFGLVGIAAELALAGSLGLTVGWLGRGRITGIVLTGDRLDILGRGGKRVGGGRLDELALEPVTTTFNRVPLPALRIAPPEGPTLVVTTMFARPVWESARGLAEASHKLSSGFLWPTLIDALGLDAEVSDREALASAPAAPTGEAGRSFPVPVLSLPVAVLSFASLFFIFEIQEPLSPRCLEASRCCLAHVHGDVPVRPDAVQACIDVATASSDRCGALAEEHRERAGGECDRSVIEDASSWTWSDGAAEVPEAPDQPPPDDLLYPRVSCRGAMERLRQAVDEGRASEPFALRLPEMFSKALVQEDSDGFVYCDGYPLPTGRTEMWSRELMTEPPGPHTLLVRARPDGRLAVAAFCRRCNAVGREARYRR